MTLFRKPTFNEFHEPIKNRQLLPAFSLSSLWPTEFFTSFSVWPVSEVSFPLTVLLGIRAGEDLT